MLDITALILTLNEAENIARCLGALSWASEILIVDSGSTDDTLAIAKSVQPNVRIVQRAFDTHAAQWNFGLEQITTPWVLALDADYKLATEMEGEIAALNPGADTTGFEASFVYCVGGRPLRASLYPPHVVLFRKDRALYVDEGHTQVLRLSGNVEKLSSRIFHDDRKPIGRWLRSQEKYSKIEARHLLSSANAQLSWADWLRKGILFAPGVVFFYLMLGKGLIFDGWRGWYYVCQRTIAEMLLSLRLITERAGSKEIKSLSD
jgi:glycosyltransferase involved in cell wall biosynthesis